MFIRISNLVLLTALAVLARPASAQEPAQPPLEEGPQVALKYAIGASDVLQVFVWKEPELTRELTVRFDGMITVPLLGDVQAAGRTPGDLADVLTRELARFIEAPRVTVGVSRATSARIYVLGQVAKSSEYPLAGPTTFIQALALAGGFKEFAKTGSIVIIRKGQAPITVNYKRIADGTDISQNVLLAPGDTIVVP